MKIIYVNCGVKNCMKDDHRSYRRHFLQLRNESLKKIVAIRAKSNLMIVYFKNSVTKMGCF